MERSSGSVSFNPSIKIAGLWKRSQDQVLSYYSGTVDRIGQLKRRIPIESIRAVEFVSESAFNLAHMLQVVYVSKKHGFVTLYVIARDKSECADWVSSLRNACYFNQDMLMHFHPGILIKNKWNCCYQSGKNALGCQPSYHLLTRSSSRYAQMRRKDTLYSVNSKRTSGHQVDAMRRSTVCADRLESERTARMIPISNSCVNLTSCTPNMMESLTRGMLTEPSASSSMVAVETAPASPHSHEGASSLMSSHEEDHESMQGLSPLSQDCSHQRTRCIAPEELSHNVTDFVSGHVLGVRNRSSEPIAYSGTYIPCYSCAGAGHRPTSAVPRWGTCLHKGAACQLSSSLSNLSKPVIEPKISNSDPTVFHV